ncbi:MAG: response regulator [Acidobacteria bacterium]|nr:response regulator [Acidobacteriota bacterium]
MSSSCVLFVDDEADFLELYRAVFSRLGIDVRTAESLAQARESVAAGGLDAIVLDIRLGDESGLSFLKELKASPARIPVVLSTAYARYQDDVSSWLADGYVIKSSDLTELKSTVQRVLEAAR